MRYLFVLGRDRELGILEVVSYLKARDVKYKLEFNEDNFLIIGADCNFSVEEFGGIIKIGREVKLDDLIISKNKIVYSVYGDVLDKLKSKFKEERVKAVFRKYSDEPNKLDLEVVEIGGKLFEIFSVSNPKEYKKRDEKRPKFDSKRVVSIRLAKILINLSQARKEILDPFCGCGTVLQEGLLKNLDVVGVDKDVSDAKANLKWLRENFRFNKNFKVIKGDAGKLGNFVRKSEVIVTEPYMGPFLKKLPQEKEAKEIVKELKVLYRDFFKEAGKVVRNKIVFVEPILKIFRGEVNTSFEDILEESGFRAVKFKEVENPITYELRGSKIKRRIWVLEKN